MLLAGCCCVLGAVAVYLSHPNQVARARRLPGAVGWLGALACVAGLGLWIAAHGVLVGLSIALTLWMLVLALLPYAALWLGHGAPGARRADRRHHAREPS